MIVQCTNCRARFRVADEKVPDKGVKVRCTKCSTVFRVTPADGVDAAVSQPGGAPPGAVSGPAGAQAFRPAAPGPLAGSPGFQAAPVPTPTSNRVVPHLPPTVSLTYGAASPHQSLDLDLSLGPPGTPMGVPAHPQPGVAPVPMAVAPASAPPMAMAPASSPPTTLPMRAPTPTLDAGASIGTNAIDMALEAAMASGAQFGEVAAPPPSAPPLNGEQSLRGLTPRPERSGGLTPGPGPVSVLDPFNLSRGSRDDSGPGIASMSPAPGSAPPLGRGQPASGSGFPNEPLAAVMAKPPREETDPFAGLDAPPGSGPATTAPPPPPPPRAAETVPPPEPPAGGTGPMPGTVSSSVREIELREATLGQKLELDEGLSGVGGLGGLGSAARASASDGTAELGRIATVPREGVAEERFTAGTKGISTARLRRENASVLLNILSIAVICYAAIVAVAAVRSPRPLEFSDLGFPVVYIAFMGGGAPSDQVRVETIRSGIYPVSTGDEVFYVAGQARNDSIRRRDSAWVRLRIAKGGHDLYQEDAVIGLHAEPEDLYGLASVKNEDLQRTLALRATTLSFEPHRSAPFVAIFKATAKDVEGAEIYVEVQDGALPSSLNGLVAGARKAEAPSPPKMAKAATVDTARPDPKAPAPQAAKTP
jgi:predicted Zn finger-like uncharacterized protein